MVQRKLYPPHDPIERGRLRVSALHEIYYEVSGHPAGRPVVVCHGGPGGGSTPSMRRFFDPHRYRIVLFDQRGCGRSTPHAELRDNTTWDLVSDMEALRAHLGIDRWQVFGGSWGSTLALAYALTHPDRVRELVLRGIFTLRRAELLWFYQEGANWLFPEGWQAFLAPIPEEERGDMMAAYYRRLTGSDRATQITAAKAWSVWEGSTVSLRPSPERMAGFSAETFALAFARIECHYFVNGGFFAQDDWILDQAPRLAELPGVIVQGRYDVVTPMRTAWELHRRWPGSELDIAPEAGHAASEPGIVDRLIRATDRFADLDA
ncbi:proline iminopeptidase chain A [Parvularcula bermudensis HTCC2503]|uniref:Proline iminopeptidase n=2 Tax=Parvularcula TaxID=208215 RepID=E0TB74_PARBH|nr:proline iminopeptidase chain A [Parvularcula bermudensis HTCC2503]